MKDGTGDVAHGAGAKSRVLFLDALRFVAAFQMLQGHTIAALLAPQHRAGVLYRLWFGARGLTSVTFLFAAGFAFYLTTARGYEARHRSPELLVRRVRRALGLIALGYALHAPIALLGAVDDSAREAALRGFGAVDVLQCIGVSLLVLQALTWILPRSSQLAAAALGLAAFSFAVTPLASLLVPHGHWAPLSSYLSSRSGSLFPLAPWAGHMFFGAACGAWLARPSRVSLALRTFAVACGVLVLGGMLQSAGAATFVADQVLRLGKVLVLAAVLAALLARARTLPAWLETLASETLFLYVFHILIVYGAGLGLADRVGPRLSPSGAVACAALVSGGSFGLVLGYRRWRDRTRLAAAPVPG